MLVVVERAKDNNGVSHITTTILEEYPSLTPTYLIGTEGYEDWMGCHHIAAVR
jgi:hypothetical protein